MDVMTMARFNIYWFLSLMAPAIVMLITTYKNLGFGSLPESFCQL
jgi:hypothetical protein